MTSQSILATSIDSISGTLSTKSTSNSASSEFPGGGNKNDLNGSDTDEITTTIDSGLTSLLKMATDFTGENGTSTVEPSTNSTSFDVPTSTVEENSDGPDDSISAVMSSTISFGMI
uniref:Uncharacterized protein n=1 Tax=Romanomermis culicivorax TaxID=13658 RepID=A0A915KQX6_ROMCU